MFTLCVHTFCTMCTNGILRRRLSTFVDVLLAIDTFEALKKIVLFEFVERLFFTAGQSHLY